MAFFEKRKRKNDDPPRIPAWVLVLIAVGAVIIIVLLFQPASRNTGESSIQAAFPTLDEPMLLTATYIIQQATAQAQGTPQPAINLNPIEMTHLHRQTGDPTSRHTRLVIVNRTLY